ncbi:MAG TPA: type II toxin-antitoxin system VapC family toxin [Firmicutes bacterium]|nr:type II toxin-antitoxin system VapC family toxin [Candidatus Fermentithermobacillaceae bacterium]
MTRRYVLDSYALLALLQDEPGAQEVEDLITSADTEISVSVINLGEVFYILARKVGREAAHAFENRVMETPKLTIADASWQRVKNAAALKSVGGLSFADCFGAALSLELDATLVTGDPEFKRLEETVGLKVMWLPRKG